MTFISCQSIIIVMPDQSLENLTPVPQPTPISPAISPNPPSLPPTPPSSPTPTIIATTQPLQPTEGPLKKILLFLLLLAFLALLGGGGFYAYNNFLANPLKILTNSFSKFSQVDFVTTEFVLAEIPDTGTFSFTLDYQKDPTKYSKIDLKLAKISNDPANNFSLSAIYKKDEIFATTSYSKFTEVELMLTSLYPEIFSTKTYLLLQPVLKGESWLHAIIPVEDFSKVEQEKSKYQVNEKQQKDLKKKFLASLSLRKFDQNYIQNGQKYYRIVYGLKKKEFVELLESLKGLNLEINVSDLNNLIRIVNSVESWNEDLVEILVEKNSGHPYSISLSLPEIPENLLEESLSEKESMGLGANLSPKAVTENLQKFFQKNKTGKLVFIGKIIFTKYNQPAQVEKPSSLVELDYLAEIAQAELGPMIQQLLQKALPSSTNPGGGSSLPNEDLSN